MEKSPIIDLLRLQLPPGELSTQIEWIGFNAQQAITGSGKNLLNALPAHRHLQLILPAAQIAGHIVPAPAHGGRHTLAIATQALEDTLLNDRDDAQITLGQTVGANRIAWVCSKQWLTRVMADLAAAQLYPESAHAEYDLLPQSNDTVMMPGSAGVLFLTAEGQPGCLEDPATAQALLGHARTLDDERLLSRPLQPGAVNLLSGAFAPRHLGTLTWSQFRRSGWLALALAGVLLLGAIIHWQQLLSREKQLKEEIRQTFAAAYPGTPIIDPVLQWQSKQREGAAGDGQRDALDKLSQFANTLGKGIQPRSAEYREGVIRLVISETDVARLRPKLETSQREFNVTPAEPGFSRVEIREGNKS